MADYIAPLDFQYVFQNVLSGSPDIFLAILLIGFSILAGIFRMSGRIYLLMFGLAGIVLYGWFGGPILLLTLVIGGIIVFYFISKIIIIK